MMHNIHTKKTIIKLIAILMCSYLLSGCPKVVTPGSGRSYYDLSKKRESIKLGRGFTAEEYLAALQKDDPSKKRGSIKPMVKPKKTNNVNKTIGRSYYDPSKKRGSIKPMVKPKKTNNVNKTIGRSYYDLSKKRESIKLGRGFTAEEYLAALQKDDPSKKRGSIKPVVTLKRIVEPKIVKKQTVNKQSEKPQIIIIPTGSLGEISQTRIRILEKTLESKLDDYFVIVPKETFEEAKVKAFEELDYDECTEDQCIMKIQELLQVENAFKMELVSEEGDTQISLTWSDQDQKRVEEDYCEGCKTKELRLMIGGLVEKLVGGNN